MNRTRRKSPMLAALLLMIGVVSANAGQTARSTPGRPLPHRVFASSRSSVDTVLARPYDAEVPFGSSGEIVWATSPQGWAFRDGVHLLYISDKDNAGLFDVSVRSGDNNYIVDKAGYMPSHVHLVGTPGSLLTASASFTYTTDNVNNPLSKPFTPSKRWTCWNSKHRTDTYTVEFGKPRVLKSVDLYFFSDVEQGGGCARPAGVDVELWHNNAWQKLVYALPRAGMPWDYPDPVHLSFYGGPHTGERVRFTFHNRGTNLYTGLYGVEPFFGQKTEDRRQKTAAIHSAIPTLNTEHRTPNLLSVEADKWITDDDVLVTQMVVKNLARIGQTVSVRMDSSLKAVPQGYSEQRSIEGFSLFLAAGGTDSKGTNTRFTANVGPGETRRFTFACAVGHTQTEAQEKLKAVLASPDPLRAQQMAYQHWFDANTAHFACSDPLVTKMYAHRWYNIKKNSMYPRLGRLRHRAFAEGRWTSDWYANVISYGAGHQVDESRWLRDPSYAWGHLQTWTENLRPDGIFPSHVTPRGQAGGQYTDWIASTAWDAYLVHPDRQILSVVADPVARNAQGWRKVYGENDSPLLTVDNHWWTGMEWQPSFFAFADYKTGGGSGEDRKYMTPLRRVDLTAYNFANARTAADIYRELNRNQDAQPLQRLADDTRDAMLAQMWNPDTRWFHSLRASDNALAPTKEIIGLYPFAFDMPTQGRGYEAIWNVALDTKQFWTRWPLASASKDCPAYSQNGWPVGPGGSICMWNGPSWPHANSLVMTAMANTLRHYQASDYPSSQYQTSHSQTGALTREKLLELFLSFTRVQYHNQNSAYPWTGEFYNGDTGAWKTAQRDYNHSTWVDPLIRHLIGLVPRNDNVLEIDSLLPPGAWSYYALDGQAYRGHDVSIAWDKTGGHIAPGFQGYSVYLDGKEIHHSAQPMRVLYNMLGRH